MYEVWKKVISVFLALVMVFQMLPATALAGNYQEEFDEEFDWEMPEKEEPDVVGEVEELREHTVKQFRLSDGSFAAVNYGIPVHYLDDDDNWVDVDNTLVYTENAGQYLSINGQEQRGFAETLLTGQPVLVSQYEDYIVKLSLLPLAVDTENAEQIVLNLEGETPEEADDAEQEIVPEESTAEESVPMESTEAEPAQEEATEQTVPAETELAPAEQEAETSENLEEITTDDEALTETESAEAGETVPYVESEPEEPEQTAPEITEEAISETTPETSAPEESAEREPMQEEDTAVPAETEPVETTVPETSESAEAIEEESPAETIQTGVSAIVINPGEGASLYGINSASEDRPLSEQVLPEKMGSYVIYESVFPGVDLMYENYGYNIKETILVNELQDSYSYQFLLNVEELTPALETDGSISLSDESGNIIYEIPAPYMYDAAGEHSYAVSYSLEPVDDDYILTVTADSEWIEEDERVLPVSIDPTITVKCEYVSGGTLYTTHVVEGDPNLAHNGDNEQYIGYGTGPNSNGSTTIQECQIFLNVAKLPDIPEGCTMVEATLQMYLYGETGYSYIGNCSTLEIAAYPVTEDESNGNYKSWIEGLTWKTRPEYDSDELIDFAVASDLAEGSYIQWDLTKQVEEWYNDKTNTNRTLALVGCESGSYTSTYCAVAVLKGYGNPNPPTLIVNYRSAIGLEDYYSAQTQSIGTAGTAYVGDYNGQLVLVKNLAANSSTVLPFSLNLVYNSYYASGRFKEAQNTGMYFGNGWKLDAVQTLTQCTGELDSYMLYIDGDGTYHYFKANSAETQWDDEDGLDLTITSVTVKNPSGTSLGTGYAIKNGQGDQLVFYNGRLVRQADANGNTIYFIYNGASDASGTGSLPTTGATNQVTKVIQKNAGSSSTVTLATLTYTTSGQLQKVTDRAGNVYTLGYDGNLLSSVENTNGYKATYTYDNTYLDTAIDVSGNYKIDYDFASDRVSAIKELGSSDGTNWEEGTKILVDGSLNKTTYRSPGPDGTISNSDDILTTYLFDDEGRTINSNTTNVNQSILYGASTGAYSTSSGTSNTNNHLINSATVGTSAVNLIKNGSFETAGSTSGSAENWDYIGTATGLAITTKDDGHRTGNYALKTWFNSSTTGTLRAYQSVSNLTPGATYTFSAYVNTTAVTAFGSGGGVYLSATGSSTVSSDTVNYVTASTMDSGWSRISVTFTASSTGTATLNIYVKNAVGTAYIDDCQLEKDDAPSNVNLVTNSIMNKDGGGWTLKSNTAYASGKGLGSSYALGISTTPVTLGYAVQSIPINLSYTETYVLSGWAIANALPSNQPLYPKMKLFSLKAELYYTDGTYDEFFLPFSAEIEDEWQYASMVLVPTKKQTVTKINVYCLYFQNTGTAYFDNISLIREPSQTMTYDSSGYLTSVATPGVGADTNTYSGGNLIKTVTSGSGTFTYNYDTKHNLTSATNGIVTQTNTYDNNGNGLKTVLSNSTGSANITTSATYTSDGNRLATETSSNGGVTKYAYSANLNEMLGLPSQVTDAESNAVSYTYNADGSINTQSISGVTSLTYEYTNLLLKKVTRKNTSTSQTYDLTYNSFGQLTKVQVGASRTLVTNSYNTAGALTKQTYGNGDYVSYTYDELGRVKTSTTKAGKTVTYAYTADGQLGSVDVSTGLSYDYLYDSLGRLITSSRHDSGTLVLETRHEYDTSNRLSKQHINLVDKTYSESYTYDSYGRISSMTAGNGSTITLGYSSLSNLETVTNSVYKKTYSYFYNSADKSFVPLVKKIVYAAVNSNNLKALTYEYTYDNLGNILTEVDPIGECTNSYSYDALGQLTNATINGKSYEYKYDGYGNILTASTPSGDHSYTYGNTVWRDLLTAYDNQNITYDNSGNPTSYYNGTRWSFTWKNGRELTAASKSGTTITYEYDGDGLRTSKTVGTTTYNYIYAGGKLIRETIGDDVVMDFFYDQNGQPYAMNYNGIKLYYVLNAQGDVVRLVTDAGTSYATYSYDAWGRPLSTPTTVYGTNNPLRYRGYVYDTESGFYYCQSRYYDPTIGRFINADSFVSTGQDFVGYNMFAYCGNNPINFSDPSGNIPELLVLLGVTVLVGVLNNVANAREYEKASGDSDLTPTSYSDGTKASLTRKEKLDYTKQQTGEETFNLNAWRYYNEYSIHELGWNLTGWAIDKNLGPITKLAEHFEDAEVFTNEWDSRWYVNMGTVVLGWFGF